MARRTSSRTHCRSLVGYILADEVAALILSIGPSTLGDRHSSPQCSYDFLKGRRAFKDDVILTIPNAWCSEIAREGKDMLSCKGSGSPELDIAESLGGDEALNYDSGTTFRFV